MKFQIQQQKKNREIHNYRNYFFFFLISNNYRNYLDQKKAYLTIKKRELFMKFDSTPKENKSKAQNRVKISERRKKLEILDWAKLGFGNWNLYQKKWNQLRRLHTKAFTRIPGTKQKIRVSVINEFPSHYSC